MSLVGDIETAAGAASGNPFAWIRIGLKALPWVLLATALAGLAITRETLAGVRADGKLAAAAAQVTSATHDAEQATRTTGAVEDFAREMLGRAPVVLQATNTVREYANTPAGRAVCAAPDVVQRTDALDQSLFFGPPQPAAGAAR